MASGTITGSTNNQYVDSKIVWSSTPDVANNKSSVTAKLYYRRNNSGYTTSGTGSFSITINGTKTTKSVSLTISTSWVLAMEATVTVAHTDNGSKSITISATGGLPPSSLSSTNCSGTAKLDTIARASEPEVSETPVVMFNSVTIKTNRKSTSFTHDLTYEFNGYEGKIASGVGESYKWTVPDLVSKISGKTHAICTIYCKTYSGSTVIGTKTVKMTLSVPSISSPSAASSVQMGKSVTIYTNRKSSGYTHKLTYAIGDASGTIGTGVTTSKPWTPPKTLAKHTGNKTSGSCTITCETYNGSLLIGKATCKITLKVPNATVPTLSASSIVLGNPITIYTPREVDCYEHDISYTLKAKNGTTVAFSEDFTAPIQESYKWTPSLSLLAPKIPKATEGTITITCTTRFKDSDTVVGDKTVSFTITVPNNSTTQPKFTVTTSPVSDISSAFDGIYVQGKSKVKVSYSASSDYSAITSYKTTILGATSSLNPYTSTLLKNDGTVTIVCRVTDARGYYTEKSVKIEVIPYSSPRIIPGENQNKIICTRSNSDETVDAGGVHLLIKIGRKYSKVMSGSSQKNYCELSYQWKTDAQGDDEYSAPVTLLERTTTSDYVSVNLPDIVSSNLTAYNIRFIAKDDVGENDAVIVTVPTAFVTWHSPPGGHGFTLGGYHDTTKFDVFDCYFDAEFEGNVSGKVLGLGELPEIPDNADLNDYKDFGVYSVRKNITAQTILHHPSANAGTLRVWSSNGEDTTTEGWKYIIQEYITYDNYCTYRRQIKKPPSESWEYGAWKVTGGLDAIILQGTTDGWYWRKYANGTAECWRRVSQTTDITTQFGTLYYGNCEEITFPFSFHSVPVVNTSIESGWSLLLLSWTGTGGENGTTTTKPTSLRVARPSSATGASFTVSYHAIGRWKE